MTRLWCHNGGAWELSIESHIVMYDETTISQSHFAMHDEMPSTILFIVDSNGSCAMKFYQQKL